MTGVASKGAAATTRSAAPPTAARQHQDSADAGQQFARIARFRQIIVRTHFQADDAIDVASHGRKHDDRRRIGSKLAECGKAIFARHHHVQHDEIEILARQQFAHRRRIGGSLRGVAMLAQELADQRADAFIVVDDEDAGLKVHRSTF